LRQAKDLYARVDIKGAELRAYEGKDRAVQAQEAARAVKADLNAPDEYGLGEELMAQADAKMQESSFAEAYSLYIDAATSFEASIDVTTVKQSEASDALAQAEIALETAKESAAELGLEDNIYLVEAGTHMNNARSFFAVQQYIDTIFEANEVMNYIGLSDNFVKQESEIREKARLEQLAKDKAAADAAIAEARTRLAWADQVDLKADYPSEYNAATNAMAAAEKAYQIEKYVPAKTLADEVCTILSDQFQNQVIAQREAARTQAAAEEAAKQKAALKQEADRAIADAEVRMAWANENEVRNSYPEEYGKASVAMVDAYVAYGNEDYARSTEKAKEVSSIFSDEFMAQVNAERAAAAQRAKEKAAADEVMPKARDRIAWADANNIAADYPSEYKAAADAMAAAEKAYQIEKYAAATELANEVLSILSPEFEAKVAAERAQQQVAELERQNKQLAEAAIADAQNRYDWAASKMQQTTIQSSLHKVKLCLLMQKQPSMQATMPKQRIGQTSICNTYEDRRIRTTSCKLHSAAYPRAQRLSMADC